MSMCGLACTSVYVYVCRMFCECVRVCEYACVGSISVYARVSLVCLCVDVLIY